MTASLFILRSEAFTVGSDSLAGDEEIFQFMHRFCRIWIYLVAILIAGLLLLAWMIRSEHNIRSVRLADGRVLTIQKITYGREHKLTYGSLWSRLIAPAVPVKWKSKTGARDYIVRTTGPSLMIWGQWEFPPKAANPAPWGVLKPASCGREKGETEVRPAGSW